MDGTLRERFHERGRKRERERGTYIERDIESDMGVEGDRGRDSERERERERDLDGYDSPTLLCEMVCTIHLMESHWHATFTLSGEI
jgi:hypothetical protein